MYPPSGSNHWQNNHEHLNKATVSTNFRRFSLIGWTSCTPTTAPTRRGQRQRCLRSWWSIYKEVQKRMKLHNSYHIQRKTAKMVFCDTDKALATCIVSMKSMSKIANKEGQSNNTCNSMTSFVVCSLNADVGVNHDHVTNNIIDSNKKTSFLVNVQNVWCGGE